MSNYMRRVKLLILIAFKLFQRRLKYFLIGFFLVVAATFLLIKLSPSLRNTNSISEGIIGTYQEHDLPETVTRLLSTGLVSVNQSGEAIPGLASGWDVNNDATVFTFKLKSNLHWSDGTPVHSSEMDFPMEDVEVSYPDDSTIQFKLKDSFAPFPTLLTKPVFKKGAKLVGVGNYSISRCNEFLIFPMPCLFKSRIFITKIVIQSTDPNLPKVNLRFYPQEKIAQTALNLGEVQSILGVSEVPKDPSPVITYKQEQLFNKVVAVFFNTKDPLLGNKQLRLALSYAIPKINEQYGAKGPIPPTSWVFNSDLKDHIGDKESAKSELARAKQNLSADDLNKEIVLTSTPQHEAIAKQIVTAWQSLGLKAILRVESGIPQNFQALLITQSIPADPDQYALWHSTQTKSNLTKYSSPRIDKDLEDGRKTNKAEDRKAKYLDFQKVLMDDAPAAFLYYPEYNIVYFKKIQENLQKILPLQLSD